MPYSAPSTLSVPCRSLRRHLLQRGAKYERALVHWSCVLLFDVQQTLVWSWGYCAMEMGCTLSLICRLQRIEASLDLVRQGPSIRVSPALCCGSKRQASSNVVSIRADPPLGGERGAELWRIAEPPLSENRRKCGASPIVCQPVVFEMSLTVLQSDQYQLFNSSCNGLRELLSPCPYPAERNLSQTQLTGNLQNRTAMC
jgi:hypothetical protein